MLGMTLIMGGQDAAQSGGGFGPELVTNGNFASSVGWTLLGGASIGGGHLNLDGSGIGSASRTAAETITAATYHYSFEVISTDGASSVTVSVGGSSVVGVPGSDAPGSFSGDIVSAASNQSVAIRAEDTVAVLDDYSVKQVL